MKEPDFLPLEFKMDKKEPQNPVGTYLIPHPLIARYFFSAEVFDEPEQERISLTLVCLVSANKKIFRNVTRYPNFDDLMMIRQSFFYPGEEVIQYVQENHKELAKGQFFSNLIRKK